MTVTLTANLIEFEGSDTPSQGQISVDNTGRIQMFVNGVGAVEVPHSGEIVKPFTYLVGPDPEDPYATLDAAITAASANNADVIFLKPSSTPYAAPSVSIPDGMQFIGVCAPNGIADLTLRLNFSTFTFVQSQMPTIVGSVKIEAGTAVAFKNVLLRGATANDVSVLSMGASARISLDHCFVTQYFDDTFPLPTAPLLSMGVGGEANVYDSTLFTQGSILGTDSVVQAVRSTFDGGQLGDTAYDASMNFDYCTLNCTINVGDCNLRFCDADSVTLSESGGIDAYHSTFSDISDATSGVSYRFESCTIDGLSLTSTGSWTRMRNCTVVGNMSLNSGSGPINLFYNCVLPSTSVEGTLTEIHAYSTTFSGFQCLSGRMVLRLWQCNSSDLSIFSGSSNHDLEVYQCRINSVYLASSHTAEFDQCSFDTFEVEGVGSTLAFRNCTGNTFENDGASFSSLSFEPDLGRTFTTFVGTIPQSSFGYWGTFGTRTVRDNDRVIGVNTSFSSASIKMPVSPYAGQRVTVFDATGNASVRNIDFTGNIANKTLITTNYGKAEFIYTGTDWIQFS